MIKGKKIYSLINNELLGFVDELTTKDEIINKYKLANQAFANFNKISKKEIILRLNKLIKIIEGRKEKLANLIMLQVHKNINDAIEEINRTLTFIKFTISEAENIFSNNNIKATGLGVVTIICSFNYPFNLNLIKIVEALICNNTIIIKSSNNTAIVLQEIIKMLNQSGFEQNVVSFLNVNDPNLFQYFYNNKYIKYLFFTGSTKSARMIFKNINPTIKYSIEGSSKNYAIVWDNINLEKTVDQLIKGCFLFNGQRCTSIKAILCKKEIYHKLIELICKKVSKLKIGSCLYGNQITELINEKAIEDNLELVYDALKHNAISHFKISKNNLILSPIVLSNISLNAKILYEEQFAPICVIKEIENIQEIKEIINNSNYGLQASIFSKNKKIIEKIINIIKVGRININTIPSRSPDELPFYSQNDSGFGYQGDVKDILKSLSNFKLIYKK